MVQRLALFLDLGDLMTKGVTLGPARRRRLRFPSVVASRLLRDEVAMSTLLLDGRQELLRPADFTPSRYPRTRSFPRGSQIARVVRETPEVNGARYAGWIAAAYGEDRQVLGRLPSPANIDALVHKAVILASTAGQCTVDVVLVIDLGAKAQALLQYAEHGRRTTTVHLRSHRQPLPRRLELDIGCRVVDASNCATRLLPPELELSRIGHLLLMDIGYFRTKVSILSQDGCEYQEQFEGLGLSDCVLRILRDGQADGLVEDELAVIRALESSGSSVIDVEGRRFDVGPLLQGAAQALADEIAGATRRAILGHYRRRGELCRGVALIGGGSKVVGTRIMGRLLREDLGLSHHWIAPNPDYLLAEGARAAFEPSLR